MQAASADASSLAGTIGISSKDSRKLATLTLRPGLAPPFKPRSRHVLEPFIQHIVQVNVCEQWRDCAPYAKGNFSFERVICDWRARVAVLDLRLKK
jgi:hypothetical protein